jgi:secreted trypsin-like serine protease
MVFIKNFLSLFLFAESIRSGAAAPGDDASSLVIGGVDAAPGDFPYYAQVLPNNGYDTLHCGGSLVAPDLVLTAAHCVDEDGPYMAVVGAYDVYNPYDGDEEGQVRNCTQVTIHPEYVGLMGEKDIALCLLNETVDIDQDSVYLELNDKKSVPAEDEMLTLMGLGLMVSFRRRSLQEEERLKRRGLTHCDSEWPTFAPTVTLPPTTMIPTTMFPSSDYTMYPTPTSSTYGSRQYIPKILQTTQIPFLNQQRCQDIHNIWHLLFPWYESKPFNVTDELICAWDSTGDTSACYGDSGGPLVSVSEQEDGRILHTLVGLVSGGFGCATMPNVYMSVEALSGWIKATACNDLGSVAEFCKVSTTKSSKKTAKVSKKSKGMKSTKSA